MSQALMKMRKLKRLAKENEMLKRAAEEDREESQRASLKECKSNNNLNLNRNSEGSTRGQRALSERDSSTTARSRERRTLSSNKSNDSSDGGGRTPKPRQAKKKAEDRKEEKNRGWLTKKSPTKAGSKRRRRPARNLHSDESDNDSSDEEKPLRPCKSKRRLVTINRAESNSSPASSVSMSQTPPTASGLNATSNDEETEDALEVGVPMNHSDNQHTNSPIARPEGQRTNVIESQDTPRGGSQAAPPQDSDARLPAFLRNMGGKKPVDSSSDDDSSEDEKETNNKPAAAQRKQKSPLDSDSDSSSDNEKKTTDKAAPGKTKNPALDSDSDSDDEKKTKERPATARKKKSQSPIYNSDSSSDEDEPTQKREKTDKMEEEPCADKVAAKPSSARSEPNEEETPKEKGKPARITNNEDDDLWMEDPKPKKKPPKKSGPAKNPLMIERRKRQETRQQQHINSSRTVDNDGLWDSDGDEGGAPASVARARNTLDNDAKEHTEGTDSDDPGPLNITPTSKNYGFADDEEMEEMKRKQHPSLEDPTFGPFKNEPLRLENKETGAKDHQVPAALARYLPDFQREGISFIYQNIANGHGAILGDDMGLGKTLQVIALISALLGKTGTGKDYLAVKDRKRGAEKLKRDLEEWDTKALLGQRSHAGKERHKKNEQKKLGLSPMAPILVVVPASVVDNWHYELSMWGYFGITVYREGKLRRKALDAIKYGGAEVLLCGHSLFGTDSKKADSHIKEFRTISWKLVVVDEFHVFKNATGNNSKNLKGLAKRCKCPVLGMTGTPMQNRYEELHNLIDLIDPGLLGTKKHFMNHIGNPIKRSRTVDATKETLQLGEKKLTELNSKLDPVYIQRFKTDVLKDLPTKVEKVVLCKLSKAQKQTYKHLLDLPDYLYVRGANAPCDCGVNVNYFEQYRRLKTTAEKTKYHRNNEKKIVKRGQCCYHCPDNEENAVLWHYQHEGKEPCERCPTCLLLPCLSKLYQLSSNLSLLQYEKPAGKPQDGKEQRDRDKREAFSKIAFPREVLRELPGGSVRSNPSMMTRNQFFMMSGKFQKLHDLLRKIEDEKGRVLLFSYSTQTLDAIESYMKTENLSFLRIDGSTPAKCRQGLVNDFQKSDDYFCFLLSTRAAGVGLNLTAANNVIIFDAEWNPALDEQAQDRSWRIGQKRNVTVYRLISQGTIDESKYLRQIYKLHLKQETFRSAKGEKKTAVPRSFKGVEKDKSRRGELFGMENLLKFSESSFMGEIFKKKGSDLVAGDTDEIAEALGGDGDENALLKMETKAADAEMCDQIEKAADKVLAKALQKNAKGEKEAFAHGDFMQSDRVCPAHEDPDEVMGGETQAVDDFVSRSKGGLDLPLSDDDDDDDERIDTAEENDCYVAKARRGFCCDDTDAASTPEKKSPSPPKASPPKTSPPNASSPTAMALKTPRSVLSSRKAFGMMNFRLCGVSAMELRKKNTTFSEADIFQPRGQRKKDY